MIVLDTNIISELWKATPYLKVLEWMDVQAVETLYLSAITVAELRYGIEMLPDGRRKSIYQRKLNNEILEIFENRVLPFDVYASKAYSKLMAKARAEGKAIGKEDGYIAATAAIRGFMVATRDERPFLAAGITVINPWNS